ncbi:MAG: hypothetical protein WBM08_12405 [Prochlorococcaceae cyanobacterium]
MNPVLLEVSPPVDQRQHDDHLQSHAIEDQELRSTRGTDRMRAGAGACELVCSQAELFDLGCYLLHQARLLQAGRVRSSQGIPDQLSPRRLDGPRQQALGAVRSAG